MPATKGSGGVRWRSSITNASNPRSGDGSVELRGRPGWDPYRARTCTAKGPQHIWCMPARRPRESIPDARCLNAFSWIMPLLARSYEPTASPHEGLGDARWAQVRTSGSGDQTNCCVRRDRALILYGQALLIVHPRGSPSVMRSSLGQTTSPLHVAAGDLKRFAWTGEAVPSRSSKGVGG
jgi:hypothetical protein